LRCTISPSSIPAVHDLIDRALSPEGVSSWLSDVHVVVDELASNIEKFAYDGNEGEYILRMKIAGGYLEMVFEDGGREFDPTLVEEAPVTDDDIPVGHLGILLIKSMVDSMAYVRRGDRNVTTMTMALPQRNNLEEDDE